MVDVCCTSITKRKHYGVTIINFSRLNILSVNGDSEANQSL